MTLITTSSAFLNELDYNNLASSEQAEIQALIEAASQLIEAYCGRVFAAADYTEKQDGAGREFIIIDNPPIISLSSVGFISPSDGTTETVDDAYFDYKSEIGEIQWKPSASSGSQYEGCFFEGFRNIVVSYRGGYETIPYPIQRATADLVKVMFDPSLNSQAIEKEKLGEYFYQLNADKIGPMLSDQNKILRLYKLYR